MRTVSNGQALLLAIAIALSSQCGFIGRVLQRNLAAPDEATVPHKLSDPKRSDSRLAVTWIGHATVLLQLDDIFVLTDPVFTHTLGQVSPRLIEPGLAPEHVPALAAVVISHMHFDHLSFSSLDMVEPQTPIALVPPGVRSAMPRYDFEIRELEPWATYSAKGLRITAVPVQHVGGRYGIDSAFEPRAFTGYVIEYHGLRVYFGGDTAYTPAAFTATRRRFPDLDAAVLPICPDEPRDFMEHTHMGPREAIDAFALLGADTMVPMHFDTFINSDDSVGHCAEALQQAMRQRHVDSERVALMGIGEQHVLVPASARP
jgi:L-ascorbate metabolism protein UlaG (beta-lactamase superfamily)